MIRIWVIENHETIILSGLKQLFRPGRDQISFIGSSVSTARALEDADPSTFDLIWLDLWIPNENPLLNAIALQEKFPGKPILVYTSEESPVWMKKMAKAGVNGYLIKEAPRSEISDAIQYVFTGKTWFPMLPPEEFAAATSQEEESTEQKLNAVQRKMLCYLTDGKSIKATAELMGLKPNQVEKTLVRLRKQYNVGNNLALVKVLTEKGLI